MEETAAHVFRTVDLCDPGDPGLARGVERAEALRDAHEVPRLQRPAHPRLGEPRSPPGGRQAAHHLLRDRFKHLSASAAGDLRF